jgi:OOP family OmpA-OmpF porin
MNGRKLVLGFGLVFTLGACSTANNVDTLNQAGAEGSAFTQTLTDEYRQIATFERDEMFDWQDATYFADKGLRAAGGATVKPERLEDWNLPSDKTEELRQARGSLVDAFNNNARRDHPELAGHAQGRFDCWIEQQEENHQPEDIAACREPFYQAMSELDAAMSDGQQEAAPEPEPEVMEPEQFMVFFGLDDASISQAQEAKIRDAVRQANEMGDASVSVTGHADTTGSVEYNQELSLRRAQNVRDALVARGVDADAISIAARGESQPANPTGDGVRSRENRRVEIVVQ